MNGIAEKIHSILDEVEKTWQHGINYYCEAPYKPVQAMVASAIATANRRPTATNEEQFAITMGLVAAKQACRFHPEGLLLIEWAVTGIDTDRGWLAEALYTGLVWSVWLDDRIWIAWALATLGSDADDVVLRMYKSTKFKTLAVLIKAMQGREPDHTFFLQELKSRNLGRQVNAILGLGKLWDQPGVSYALKKKYEEVIHTEPPWSPLRGALKRALTGEGPLRIMI